MSTSGGTRAIIAAFLANLGIAIAKLVGFAITGSSSMLAESIHSLADTGNQGLLMLGRRRADRDADAARPFGYGRERFFWAFVVALVLFSLGDLSYIQIAETLGIPIGTVMSRLHRARMLLKTELTEYARAQRFPVEGR